MGVTIDEEFLITKLKTNIGKWFVPYVLSVTENFSEKMMKELLETAINIYNPSHNYCFINPAIRVYNFDVYDYFISRFKNATFKEKKGIFRALYWAEIKAVWRKETDKVEDDYQVKYKWNKKGYYEEDFRISEVEEIGYKADMNLLIEKKIDIFVDEFLITKNKKLKYYISLNLPKEINEFPDRLKEKGKIYLEELKK